MATKRLTDVGIERLAPPASGRLEVWDSLAPGLGVRVGQRRKSFIVMVRVRGVVKRLTLGVFPALSIAEAREKAREVISLAQNGEDPVARQRHVKAQKAAAERATVAATVEDYIERYAKPRTRSWPDTAARLRNHLVGLHGDRPVASLTRADIIAMLDAAAERGLGVGVNRVLANAKTYLRWCVERGLIERSPAETVRAPMPEVARDRILDDDELAAVWCAAEAAGYPFGVIVQLLILTGQRRDEVAHMRWAEIDRETATWTLPPERNKSGRAHIVPLAPAALALIEGLTPVGPLLFPAQNNLRGGRAFSGWSKAKRRLDEASGVAGWRLHDLRRTAASGMARLGHDPQVVERVLNHATTSAGPLARVYQRYAYEPEKRRALEEWAGEVARVTSQASHADVALGC